MNKKAVVYLVGLLGLTNIVLFGALAYDLGLLSGPEERYRRAKYRFVYEQGKYQKHLRSKSDDYAKEAAAVPAEIRDLPNENIAEIIKFISDTENKSKFRGVQEIDPDGSVNAGFALNKKVYSVFYSKPDRYFGFLYQTLEDETPKVGDEIPVIFTVIG